MLFSLSSQGQTKSGFMPLLSRNIRLQVQRPVTLWPCVNVTFWPSDLYLLHTHTHTYTDTQTLKCDTDLYIWKQTNTPVSSRAQTYQLWHILYSLTHMDINTDTVRLLTHCLIWSSLEQEICRRERGGAGKKCFNLPFSRKKENAEALLPGTARGQRSSLVYVCTYTHLQLPSVLRKHP